MAIQPVPAAPAALPFPGLNEKAAGTYNAAAFAWGNQMPAYADGIKALGDNAFNNATEAKGSADMALDKAGVALAARDQAVAAAHSALNSPGTMATSSTSMALTAGTRSIVLDQVDKHFAKGQYLIVAATANPTVQAGATLLDFDAGTGAMTLSLDEPSGSGTYAAWTVSVGARPTAMTRIPYASRGELRSTSYYSGGAVLVEALGLFIHVVGSTEVDDDESCFATSTGRWLLEAVNYELMDAWMQASGASGDNAAVLYARGLCPIATVASGASASFNVQVPGASVGDRVLVNYGHARPPTGGATIMGYVSVNNLVTITISTMSASSGGGAAQLDGLYSVTVFKEI